MNAYELADELVDVASITKPTDDGVTYGLAGYCIKASNMLRQQADRIAELELKLGVEEYLHKKLATAKPLSDKEIAEIGHKHGYCLNFARAIEERHGIK